MNKLRQVREALERNPKIKIIEVFEKDYLPGKNISWHTWAHTVDFYVAPIEDIFQAEKLQKLMMSLIKKPKETMIDEFTENETTFRFGKLYFDEVIGQKKTTEEITITDTDIIKVSGLERGRYEIFREEQLKRRIWVRLFPTVESANQAINGDNDSFVYKKDLGKFQF